MGEAFRLDPDRVAYFEAEGWRAYYDRRWLRLIRLTVQLNEEQFRIPAPQRQPGTLGQRQQLIQPLL